MSLFLTGSYFLYESVLPKDFAPVAQYFTKCIVGVAVAAIYGRMVKIAIPLSGRYMSVDSSPEKFSASLSYVSYTFFVEVVTQPRIMCICLGMLLFFDGIVELQNILLWFPHGRIFAISVLVFLAIESIFLFRTKTITAKTLLNAGTGDKNKGKD